MHVQHRFQHLIVHADEPHGPVHAGLVSACHDGDGVTDEADPLVQDQTVIGRGLGEGLACLSETVLGDILVGEDALDAGDLHGDVGVDALDPGVSMGAAQNLDHQTVLGSHIVQIDGLAQQELHGVLFADGGIDCPESFLFHVGPPYCFRWSR